MSSPIPPASAPYISEQSSFQDLNLQVPVNLPPLQEDDEELDMQQEMNNPAASAAADSFNEYPIIPFSRPPPPAPPIIRDRNTVYKLIKETLPSPGGRVEYYFYKAPSGNLFAKRAFDPPNALPKNYTNVVSQNLRTQAKLLGERHKYGDL